MKLAVFTVMLPDLTPELAVRELRAAGYEGVEWRVTNIPETLRNKPPSFWGNNLCTLAPNEKDASRARNLADSTGLAVPNLGTYIAVGDLPAVEEAMNFAQIAGSSQIRVSVGTLQREAYTRLFAASKAFLVKVEALARLFSVRALVEIHHGTICPSASSAYRLVSHFDPEAIGVIYDPGNMVFEGFEDYRLGIELLGPYLAHVHIKNAAYTIPEEGGVWMPRWAPLEDGVVNFTWLFMALQEAGYDGWLSMEDFSETRPSREALRHNYDFIQDIFKKN
jgi:sugar phosphate isomerase/epimerase